MRRREGAANATRIYAHGNRVDEIVADYNYSDTQFRYHHYDARGHCILLTNQLGNLIEQYDYDAFGQPYFYNGYGTVLPNGSLQGNRFLFTGREWLPQLRGYDYRNRLYMPQLGRFLQPDPKHFEAGDYNLYRYCHNDPVNRNDPLGLGYEDHMVTPDPATRDAIAGAVVNHFFRMWDRFKADVADLAAHPEYMIGPGNLGMARAGFSRGLIQGMLKAGTAADRGGLTVAGRALEKHGSRLGSVFPKATGNAASKNAQGEQVLRNILSSTDQTRLANRYGGQDIFDNTTGQGVRFDGKGNMKGFLEPQPRGK